MRFEAGRRHISERPNGTTLLAWLPAVGKLRTLNEFDPETVGPCLSEVAPASEALGAVVGA